jgi:hypothetical protein
MSEDNNQQFHLLDKDDLLRQEKQRKFVYEITRRLDIEAAYKQTEDDLEILQKIVDSKALSPNQTWELQSLGVVLGDIFAHKYGLRWVVLVDEYGRDQVLRYKDTANLVFPLTMISKRVEDKKQVNIFEIYQGVSSYIEDFH